MMYHVIITFLGIETQKHLAFSSLFPLSFLYTVHQNLRFFP